VLADATYLRFIGIRTITLQASLGWRRRWRPVMDALRAQGITCSPQRAGRGRPCRTLRRRLHVRTVTYTRESSRVTAAKAMRRLICAPSVGPGYDARRGRAITCEAAPHHVNLRRNVACRACGRRRPLTFSRYEVRSVTQNRAAIASGSVVPLLSRTTVRLLR